MIGHGRRSARSRPWIHGIRPFASAARAPILPRETTPSRSGPPTGRAERGNHLGAYGVRGANPDRKSGSADRPREPVSSPRRPTTDRGPPPARIRTPCRRRLRRPARRGPLPGDRARALVGGRAAARRSLLPTPAGVLTVTPTAVPCRTRRPPPSRPCHPPTWRRRRRTGGPLPQPHTTALSRRPRR